ncbi:MAG: hypothetical protein WHT29_03140 [Bacteroidales bacterium]|nr:hypothetical protein [Bacteroidales bacterium]HOK98650.1 hypothetical protein [Bacteroidales bacterium]HPO65563.1 hypothetical protein [Bacteroidales bacterium]
MIAVLTGDIIHSSRVSPEKWLKSLTRILQSLGESPRYWEIFRGDSFQAEVSNPLDALQTSIKIKAAIKAIKGLDVRVAIGIGEKSYEATRITESNGSAYVHSGRKFDALDKEKINLGIQSPWNDFDKEMNLYLRLALIAMDNWTTNGANMVLLALEHQQMSQEELGKLVGIKQNTVSARLKRAYFAEILALIEMYREKLNLRL